NGPGEDTRAPEHKQPNLAGQPRPRQRYDRLDLLLEREPRGVEYHRVGGGSERRHRPRGISAVPRLQHVNLAPQLGVPAPAPAPGPAALGQPAPRPLLGTRREKHLQGGIREHDRPDVPAVHHRSPLPAPCSPRLSSTASVIARYNAPESRCVHPRRRATREAVELLPEAAGPSIAMTRRVTVSPFPFPLSRCDASRQRTEGS